MSELYKAAGVDIARGDMASRIAYSHAKATFGTRQGRMGAPINVEGGFSGVMDMGAFCLTMNSDGVGTKALIANRMRKFDTLGWDLVAMVADDADCLGAAPMAMVNTLDIDHVDTDVVESLMGGLEVAAKAAGCTVVGGEIAEMPDVVYGLSWSASLVGIAQQGRLLDGRAVRAGDTLVALHTDNFRSNGFSLVRRILMTHFGADWVEAPFEGETTWGEVVLAPSRLFTPLVNALTGGFDGTPKARLHAVAHITGGGLRGNVGRVIPPHLRIIWDALPPIPDCMKRLMEMGQVPWAEAETVWNLGVGMVLVTDEPEAVLATAKEMGYAASCVGRVTEA
ncbi:MAG: phosphoribosylformylglycinamidine cyclo-ligase [Candidatus Xenobia bacterium]